MSEIILEKPQSPVPQVMSIPLSQIRPNPNNPRKIFRSETIERLAASMRAIGQETPIKVRKLGVGPSTPETSVQYELVGGHRRLKAAQNLGWVTLNAYVLDITSVKAELSAFMDNEDEGMHWLERYEAIERLSNVQPKPTQQELADELSVNQATISRALKVTSLLTPSARQAIYATCIKSPDADPITEWPVRTLCDLEDPQRVEEALKVVLDKGMTQPQAKALVAAMKAGTPAKDHVTAPKAKGGKNRSQLKADSSQEGKTEATPSGEKAHSGTHSTGSPQAGVAQAQEGAPSNPEHSRGARNHGGQGSRGDALWAQLAGLPLIQRVKAKLQKGEPLTGKDKLVILLNQLILASAWAGKHLLRPLGKLVLRTVLWSFRTLRGWAKSAVHSTARLLGGTAAKLFQLVAPALLVVLAVWVGWNWKVNHVGPGEQVKRLGGWAWGKVHGSRQTPVDNRQSTVESQTNNPQSTVDGRQEGKTQEKTKANLSQKPEIATSATAPIGAPPRNDGAKTVSQEKQAGSQPAKPAKPQPAQGDVLSQAGDAVDKAAGALGQFWAR